MDDTFDEMRILSLVARKTVNAVILTDKEEKIVWVNEGFTNITGYSAAEAIGKTAGSLLQGRRTNRRMVQYMSEKKRKGEDFECEILNYKKDGTPFWMRMQAQPVHDESGKLIQYFGLGTDITDQKKWRNRIAGEKLLRQKAINRAILKAQESERAAIGRELHDNVNQLLASVKLYLTYMANEQELHLDVIQSCSDYVSEAIDEIRRLTRKFVLPVSKNMALAETLEELTANLERVGNLKVILETKDLVEKDITLDCKQNILRIIQEQLNNTIKYANATTLKIRLANADKGIELLMTDDGKGFDPGRWKKGLGWTNIRHRAESFNGHAEVLSAEGQGCTLRVSMPLDHCAA